MTVRLNKIYTRTGDKGTTAVVGGETVSKGSMLVESYGTVDELNSHLGMLRALASQHPEVADESESYLADVQQRLFDLGSIMATPPDNKDLDERLATLLHYDDQGNEIHIRRLEQSIDDWNSMLEPPKSFVLPGGNSVNAQANICRTVCRRLERIIVRRCEEFPLHPDIGAYFNRLSDYLFVYSRWVTMKLGGSEIYWKQLTR